FPIVALDRALDREHFTSVVGADQDDAEMLAEELRKFPAETVLPKQQPELTAQVAHALLMPDYFSYRLTGKMNWEYTNATTTQLV
ncbi:hypothetical protein MJM45_29475, partial [Salmonella enterica subsp. enterica serovar Kentucky]|nr:hypothetical protein [Salmonella enterica subsp. enterica serovar Kentucky]